MRAPIRIVFVCSGNICRSPTAEVVINRQAQISDRTHLVTVASAGTGGWHAGDDMDARSRATLDDASYDPPAHVARQFEPGDFDDYDVVVALDSGHYADLRSMAERGDRDKIVRLRDFDPELGTDTPDVADPYYGGASGFTDVLEQIERSCATLLDAIETAVRTDGPLQQPDRPLL